MAVKINPFHQLTWRSPNTLQIGTDYRAKVIDQVSPAQERFINALYFGMPESQLSAVARQVRLPEEQAAAVLNELSPLLIKTTDAWEPSGRGLSERVQASMDNGADDGEVMSHRFASVVQINQLDATGLGLTLAMAAAGVGTILSPDHSKVTEADCASNLYPRALLGYQRFQAAKLILDSSWPGSRMVSAARVFKSTPKPRLAVLTSHQATPVDEVGRWRTLGVPILEIRYHSIGVEISPVLTAESPCLLCREQHNQDLEPTHLSTAAQLCNSQLTFDDSATRLVGIGLALHQILRFLDGTAASVNDPIGLSYNRLPEIKLEARPWLAHPKCGCQIGVQPDSWATEPSLAAAG